VYRMTILYGLSEDPAAFEKYYREVHIPIARKMKGLRKWNLSWIDPPEGVTPQYQLVAELYARTRADLETVLASPEGLAASEDLKNFVTGTVDFLMGDEEWVELD
jgi:uncharacterized protein (TIGR02118 family)